MSRICSSLVISAFASFLLATVCFGQVILFAEPDTIARNFDGAAMIVHAKVLKVRKIDGSESLEWHVQKFIKAHAGVGQALTFPVDKDRQDRVAAGEYYVLACDVNKQQIEPYFGLLADPKSALLYYAVRVHALSAKPRPERLRFFADHLEHPEVRVASDAHNEFILAEYRDYAGLARQMDPKLLEKWLDDPKTPPERHAMYAELLGHCGSKEHAKIFERLLQAPRKRFANHDTRHRILFGYLALDQTKGWDCLVAKLKDGRDSWMQDVAYWTLRRVYEQGWDLIDKDEKRAKDKVAQTLALLLDETQSADLAIDDMLRWKRWEMTGRIVAVFDTKLPASVKNSILRFALRSPDARAAEFVRQQRHRDEKWVRETEQSLLEGEGSRK